MVNVTAGFINLCLLLFIVHRFHKENTKRIHEIKEISEKNEDVLKRTEFLFEQEQKIAQFEKFLKFGSYRNVRFPDLTFLNHPIGLRYTIQPARDDEFKPRKKSSEMGSYWIVKVLGPANEKFLSNDELLEYENSPIKDGEYYWCSFFNDEWHMSEDSLKWHKFHLCE